MKELIEKAERLDRNATPGVWDTYEDEITAGDNLLFKAGHRSQATAYDMLFVSQARTLLPALAAELRRLTELRPIAEAPRDGTWVILCWIGPGPIGLWEPGSPQKRIARWVDDDWRGYKNEGPYELATHWLPLPDGMPR